MGKDIGVQDIMVVRNLVIYAKAVEVGWQKQEELSGVVIRLSVSSFSGAPTKMGCDSVIASNFSIILSLPFKMVFSRFSLFSYRFFFCLIILTSSLRSLKSFLNSLKSSLNPWNNSTNLLIPDECSYPGD